jgi:hypothetical protein
LVEDQPHNERSSLPLESKSPREHIKEELPHEATQIYEEYMDGVFVEEPLEQPNEEDLDENLECENDQFFLSYPHDF